MFGAYYPLPLGWSVGIMAATETVFPRADLRMIFKLGQIRIVEIRCFDLTIWSL